MGPSSHSRKSNRHLSQVWVALAPHILYLNHHAALPRWCTCCDLQILHHGCKLIQYSTAHTTVPFKLIDSLYFSLKCCPVSQRLLFPKGLPLPLKKCASYCHFSILYIYSTNILKRANHCSSYSEEQGRKVLPIPEHTFLWGGGQGKSENKQ